MKLTANNGETRITLDTMDISFPMRHFYCAKL